MIPKPGKTLTDLATRITTHLVPATYSTFLQADAGLISMLLITMAQDYERAIFNRMTDIEEMKAVFAACPNHAPCVIQRSQFNNKTPHSLLLDDVTELHREGFELLIKLHAWSEDATQADHRTALNQSIWKLLRNHSERNKFDLPIT